jgi:hypothetical protein
MEDKPAFEQIDVIIKTYGGWKGDTLAEIRASIIQAHPEVVEEIKWRMKTRPEGLPVWSSSGILCFAETWKDNIKLLFPKGAHLKDSNKLFNARLEGKDIRAIQFKEGDKVNKSDLVDLVREAVLRNS